MIKVRTRTIKPKIVALLCCFSSLVRCADDRLFPLAGGFSYEGSLGAGHAPLQRIVDESEPEEELLSDDPFEKFAFDRPTSTLKDMFEHEATDEELANAKTIFESNFWVHSKATNAVEVGKKYVSRGEFSQALEWYDLALRSWTIKIPKHRYHWGHEARIVCAYLLLLAGKYKSSLSLIENLLIYFPASATLLHNKTYLLDRVVDRDDAR